MYRYIVLSLILLSPTLTFAQSYISADSANKIIMNGGDCSDRTFTRVEKIPSLKIPKQSFEDTLTLFLKSKKAFHNNQTIVFNFVVDCHAEIHNMQKLYGSVSDEKTIREAILKFSGLWLPARQNNYIVSSYVTLKMGFTDDKLNIDISQ